jgi:hypothetical protein
VGTDANAISRCSRLLLHARANFVPNPACQCSWLTRRWCICALSNVGNLVQLGVHHFESACRRAICTPLHRKYIRNQETCRKLRLVHFEHVARLFRFFSNRDKKCLARTSRFLISWGPLPLRLSGLPTIAALVAISMLFVQIMHIF